MVIAPDRMWWVPQLDQLLERVEAAVSRQSGAATSQVREVIATQLAARIRDRSWEEVALELLLEQEGTGR